VCILFSFADEAYDPEKGKVVMVLFLMKGEKCFVNWKHVNKFDYNFSFKIRYWHTELYVPLTTAGDMLVYVYVIFFYNL